MLVLPLFVSLTVSVPVWPTVTLPKLTDVGLIVRLDCVPVPVNEMASGELDALLVTVRVPLIVAADCGAN